MHQYTTVVFFAVLAFSLAFHLGDSYHEEEHGHETKKDYNFDYTVHDPHTHDYHSHQESSKDGVVKGYYSVKDADGSLREVHYTADPKNGFKAVVTKNGVQIHPHTQESSDHHEHHEAIQEHHHIPEHHEEVEHHFPEHHEALEHHEPLDHHQPEHHESYEHHEHHIPEHHEHHIPEHHEHHAPEHHEHHIPEHHEHHIPQHHEHPFAVGLSSLHDIHENHFQHHSLEHFHHY